jgi:hypothetical protein
LTPYGFEIDVIAEPDKLTRRQMVKEVHIVGQARCKSCMKRLALAWVYGSTICCSMFCLP